MNVNEDLKFLLNCKKQCSVGGRSDSGEGRVWGGGVRMDKWGGGRAGEGVRVDVDEEVKFL